MDISRMPNDKKLYLCKCYFRAGIFLLPFVWAVNAVWFYNEAFKKPPFEQQKQIKNYVIYSMIGTVVWAVILIAWIVTFQLNRSSWGDFADDISFIIPLGTS